jgi:hypothetical protein
VKLEGVVGAVGDEPNAIDVFGAALRFAQDVEDEPLVYLLVLLYLLIDLEGQSASALVVGVLPGRADPLPEITDRVDVAVAVTDVEPNITHGLL